MRKILLLGMARESSTRCKNKMIKYFHNTTLFDIYAKKLQEINEAEFSGIFNRVVLAVSPLDKILWEKSKKYSVDIIERSYDSIKQGAVLNETFGYLDFIDEDYVMWVNGCFPFLSVETIASAGAFFKNSNGIKSLHCVIQRKNWFWQNGRPLNIKSGSHSKTQDSLPIFESVHCFHIFNRKYLLDNCAYWDFSKNNPYLYEVEEDIEFLDIDTDDDFKICHSIARYG